MAERISLCFDRSVYKNKKVRLMPEVVSAVSDGSSVTLTFDQPLRPCADLYEFEVAGQDGRFQNATARADGNRVIISSPVAQPCRVRHAWKDNPIGVNAYSQAGWPLSPFQLSVK